MSAPVPRVGCGAAIVRNGLLLLVKRLTPPEVGSWSLPGGKVEFGERLADAIAREIREEIGVEIAAERPLVVVETPNVDGQHWIAPVYLARLIAGEPHNCEPTKHADVAWFPLDRPPAPLSAAARDAFAALGGGGA
jgi:ADP-ribose pyrophosphatase YjhB (NUDIX family)